MAKVTMREGENDFVGAMVFHKRVKMMLADMLPDEDLVIDLGGYYADSTLLGTLLAIFTSCKKQNRRMVLENVSAETRKLLEITGVNEMFNGSNGKADDA